MSKPNLFLYQNVFLFLQDYYNYRRQQDKLFSYQIWCKELKFTNRSYLRLVTFGKRPVSEKLCSLFVIHFNFSAQETDFFTALVHFTQCKDADQRKLFAKQLLSFSQIGESVLETQKHFDFLSNSILPKLQTLLSFEDIQKTATTLAQLLDISETELVQNLTVLEKIGLVTKATDKNAQVVWQSLHKAWKVPESAQALGHQEFYRNSLKEAEQAIQLPFSDRRFRSLFWAMNEKEFNAFLKDFEIFVREQMNKHNVDHLNDRRLFQMNFNFFSVSKPNLMNGTN